MVSCQEDDKISKTSESPDYRVGLDTKKVKKDLSSDYEDENEYSKGTLRHEDSSEYSSDQAMKRPMEYDSSDYSSDHGIRKLTHADSSEREKGYRPDSFISDTSSDYSFSNI